VDRFFPAGKRYPLAHIELNYLKISWDLPETAVSFHSPALPAFTLSPHPDFPNTINVLVLSG
jgi:hypothetical protein